MLENIESVMNKKLLHRRHRRERHFIIASIITLLIILFFLLLLITTLVNQGWRALLSASVQLDITMDSAVIGKQGEESALRYQRLIRSALLERFPEANTRKDKKALYKLMSFSASIDLRNSVQTNPELIDNRITVWLRASSIASRYLKGSTDSSLPEKQRDISNKQIDWLDTLKKNAATQLNFNSAFFVNSDSRDAESAGISVALIGSFYSLLLAFIFSFPIAVISAIYLEIFAPKNRWFDFIEININNLAAVPSIVFGLLGLSIFINFFGLPRSSPLVGGLVLSLMTLPTMIITSRAALQAVPPSYMSAALSMGATKMQAVFHHVVPSAMPGILTGTIIGMAGTLGETAPLLMIGMVAFITEMPSGVTDAATALPVQIFLWADSPERGFVEKTAAAILVLLFFLITMNALAIYLRRKFEK